MISINGVLRSVLIILVVMLTILAGNGSRADHISDRNQLLDIASHRTILIDNITMVFMNITARMVRTGSLMQETARKLKLFTLTMEDISDSASMAFLALFLALILVPILIALIISLIICCFFRRELHNLQTVLHTRWDCGDEPDIVSKSKAKYRLGNLAMPRLYKRMSGREGAKLLPKQAKRDPEAFLREKKELELRSPL